MSQLWETSYGRTLLVKSALLLVLVALGWLNRRRLAAGFARLRPIALAELLVLLVVVGAVGTLTDLRPGSGAGDDAEADAAARRRSRRRRRRAAPSSTRGQAGPLAVGFAYQDGRATVTLTDGDGDGVTDTPVTIDGAGRRGLRPRLLLARRRRARRRGRRRRHGTSASTSRGRSGPRPPRSNRLRRDYDALESVVIDERLSSGPGQPPGVALPRSRRPAAWPT